jgi:siroheme synthase-like protein
MSGAARPELVGWPVNLLVRGRRVVVVGAGAVAARKVASLLDLGADVLVIAPEIGAEVRAFADQGRCAVQVKKFEPADLDGAWLAVTATPDASVNRAVKEAGDARLCFVNSADDPENCSFTLMSTVRRSDLVVAIGTGGRSPALAAWLRRRIEAELGPELEVLLDLLAEARAEVKAAGRATEDLDWQRAFDEGILVLVREGRVAEARELLRSCL